MKKPLLTTAILLFLPASASYAVDAHHPEQQGQGQSMSSPQGGGMMMENMQAHMKKMMRQMDQIRKTEDPDKRDKLIDEHMKSMQEGMGMMRGMGGGMMMGGKPQDGQMGGDMMMRINNMEQRMDMMQMMMDQMVQSQDAMETTRRLHDHRKVHK